ncbi:MAG: GPO family capsid scaffolding protein, partial [Litorimonas sp.]
MTGTPSSLGLISAFFIVGLSGPTVDGREVSPAHIEEMAETYDPAEYTALINAEHVTGLSPYGDYPALGEVVALKAETDGKGRMALWARVKPTVALLNINARGQKLFPSMEVISNFAGTGKAYLVGLAMTDRPASLGTQAIQYAAQAGGPDDARFKTHLFSQHIETEPFTMDQPSTNPAQPAASAQPDAPAATPA